MSRITLHPDTIAHVLALYEDLDRHDELRAWLRVYRSAGLTQEYITETLGIRECPHGHFQCEANTFMKQSRRWHHAACKPCQRRYEAAWKRRRRQHRAHTDVTFAESAALNTLAGISAEPVTRVHSLDSWNATSGVSSGDS